jgi:DNA repair protein RadC
MSTGYIVYCKANSAVVKRSEQRTSSNTFVKLMARNRYYVSQVKVLRIREGSETPVPTIDSPDLAAAFWRVHIVNKDWYNPDQEALVVLCLDAKQTLTSWSLISLGTVNESLAHPREIFRPTIAMNAYSFILMHNHPSGDPTPSEADIRLTRRIAECARLLQIQFLDHVIVGDGTTDRRDNFSFKVGGYLS